MGHETQSTTEKLGSLRNQFSTPMHGSHKDVLVIVKPDTSDEGNAGV